MNMNDITKNLPPQVSNVVDQLLQIKIGNIKLDFSKVKFPTTPEQWEELGKKIQEELKKAGQQITIEDAIKLAQRMAQVARNAQQQNGQPPSGGQIQTPPPNSKEKAKKEIKNELDKSEKEVSSFIEIAGKDKRYWFGILLLVLLLRRK